MKTERLTLFELGEEYEKNAAIQRSFIENCRRDIKRARESGDFKAEEKLKADLLKLYEIKRELLSTAAHLKNYYKGEN